MGASQGYKTLLSGVVAIWVMTAFLLAREPGASLRTFFEGVSSQASKSSTNDQNDVLDSTKTLLPQEPIIVVGLPKSGTTSVWSFFTCNNYSSQHYCSRGDTNNHPPCKHGLMSSCIMQNMIANRSNIMKDCGDYQVYAQIDGERPVRRVAGLNAKGMLREDGSVDYRSVFGHFIPQHFYLKELNAFAPKATYLLPLRNATSWATSVMNWFQLKLRVWTEFKHLRPKKPTSRKEWIEFLSLVYETHTKKVRDFVKVHPSHDLVEFDITGNETALVLAKTFGLDENCWGHHNKARTKQK